MRRPVTVLVAACLTGLVVLAAGCSGEDPSQPADPGRDVLAPAPAGQQHTHIRLVGDGTTADAGGYRMADLRFALAAGKPGDLSFRILDSRGEPVTDYVEEQTKLLHLYVVRDDYGDFRHLHPVLGDDGTWTARADLATAGGYRVVAEFVPADEPDGAHVVVGERARIADGPAAEPVATPSSTGSDGLVTVAGPASLEAGVDRQFDMTVSDGAGGVPNLGTYLGTYAHVTGFEVETGAFVHAHPLGAPTVTDDGSVLSFHTALDVPGTYRLFVQVRVDGFVHTVPIVTTVG